MQGLLTLLTFLSPFITTQKDFSSKNVISKHYLVTVVTVVTIKYTQLNNNTIYYYIYTYIIIDLKENVRAKITVTTVTERFWSTIKGI
jgi:hypothetical protein